MALSLKKRFAIFERDNFTCQYCGKQPPNAILEVDHAVSKKDGGTDDEKNLITSCFECNRGKSKKSVPREITDFKEQEKQLKEKERQIKKYINFLKKKTEVEDISIIEIDKLLSENGESLTKIGKRKVKNLIKKYGLKLTIDAIQITLERNIDDDCFIKYTVGVLKNLKVKEEDPFLYRMNEEIRKAKNKFYKKVKEERIGYLSYKEQILIKEFCERHFLKFKYGEYKEGSEYCYFGDIDELYYIQNHKYLLTPDKDDQNKIEEIQKSFLSLGERFEWLLNSLNIGFEGNLNCIFEEVNSDDWKGSKNKSRLNYELTKFMFDDFTYNQDILEKNTLYPELLE